MSKRPELIFNHSWEIQASYDENGMPVQGDPDYFQRGDRFCILGTPGRFPITLSVYIARDDKTYELHGTLEWVHEPSSSNDYLRKIIIRFFDTINGINKVRFLTVSAAKISGHFDPQDCSDHFERLLPILKDVERAEACSNKNTVIWKVENDPNAPINMGAQPNSTEGAPEPGQGTGSGD